VPSLFTKIFNSKVFQGMSFEGGPCVLGNFPLEDQDLAKAWTRKMHFSGEKLAAPAIS